MCSTLHPHIKTLIKSTGRSRKTGNVRSDGIGGVSRDTVILEKAETACENWVVYRVSAFVVQAVLKGNHRSNEVLENAVVQCDTILNAKGFSARGLE